MMAKPAVRELEQERLREIGRKVRRRLAANKAVHRIPVDQAELWAVGEFLDPLECGRLMAIIDLVAEPSTTYDHDDRGGFRTSYSSDLDPKDPFIRGVETRIDRLLGIDPSFGEILQGQRYHVGQAFSPHTDWFPWTSEAWVKEQAHGGQRSFTAMAYLNAVEEGGETDFPNLDIAMTPNPGVLLIWNNADESGTPSRWTFHAGNPVIRGVKYIFTKWYRIGPWR